MTAPDVNADVRARFEAWHDAKWPKPTSKHPHLQEAAEFHWRQQKATRLEIWQAAHADLAGEVRELVEADREYDAAMRSEADTDGMLRREAARERRKSRPRQVPPHPARNQLRQRLCG